MSEMNDEVKLLKGNGAIKILAISLIFVLTIGSIAILVSVHPASDVPAHVSSTTHAPISIDGNLDFSTQATAESWSGDGSPGDPYIIADYVFNSVVSTSGISIQNTNVHFVIRNCSIIYGQYTGSGINLFHCTNGTLKNNTCSYYAAGIGLSYSSNYTIIDNNCSLNGYGIGISSSFDNTIIDNNCSSNGGGISIVISFNNTISSNNCSNNFGDGIGLDHSSNNTVSSNNCSNNVGAWAGIHLDYSSNNNTIRGNNCSSNSQLGIYLNMNSDNNTVSNNNCSLNGYSGINSGIYLTGSNNNMIWGNRFVNNNGAGSVYDINHIQAYDDGTNNRWNNSRYGNYWSDWTTPDNSPPWRIIDNPYNISGSAGAKDYYPISLFPPDDEIAPITNASLSGIVGTNGWFRSNVSVSLAATDYISGVNATYYRVSTSGGGWLTYFSSFILSSDGISTVQFYSKDNAGNNELMKNVIVKIDKTAPTLTFNQSSGMTVTKNYTFIGWIGADATSGINHFEVSIDGGAFVSVGMAMSHNFSGLADGTHNVTVKTIDVAGNEVVQTIQFTVDTSVSGILILYGAIVAIIILAIIAVIVILMKKNKKKP